MLIKTLCPCFGEFRCGNTEHTAYGDPKECPVAKKCLDKFFRNLYRGQSKTAKEVLSALKEQILTDLKLK